MSSTSPSPFAYRRRLGRAPSPPTWAWYEQIALPDDESDTDSADDESCSEDDEDYPRPEQDRSSDSGTDDHVPAPPPPHGGSVGGCGDGIDDDGEGKCERGKGEGAQGPEGMETDSGEVQEKEKEKEKKDVKGKQRAVQPDVEEAPRRRERRKKHREPVYTLRPILTIQKSQGFVWNQDLFVPPYIKDRYIASTSPPNAGLFAPASSMNSLSDYEVEVVEIRVEPGEFANIIP